METWFIIVASIGLATITGSILFRRRHGSKLPPGPSLFFSHLLVLTNPLLGLQLVVKDLVSKYGPVFTLSIGTHTFVFVGSRSLSHQMLIKKGTHFSDRPNNMRLGGIGSAPYGSTWRLFRHNLVANVLHPSNVKSCSWARKWVLSVMIDKLQEQQEAEGKVKVAEHIHSAMLRLSLLMCFGEKVDDHRINDITRLEDGFFSLVSSLSFNAFYVSRWLAKILFTNQWKKFVQLRHDQRQLLISLIKSRTGAATSEIQPLRDNEQIVAYVDTLLTLQVPDANGKVGKVSQREMVSLCNEFLVVGAEPTSTTLQWIMANLVKHPSIQRKLYDEIVAVVGSPPPPPPPGVELESVINEENLQKIPYLKAVVLEGLRRHPPGHLGLPHRVSEEVELQGCKIPKGATVNFMVAEMGWDPEVWDDPMEFKPERFLSNAGSACVFDITGSKGIKMMPFGVGRRLCPGVDLALLHLEYFVANLIWYFHWSQPHGYQVDFKEKVKFSVVMKNPPQTKIFSRTKATTT